MGADMNLYFYRARMVSVYDGDTITVDIDQGFGIWQHSVKLRLYGIDTPELRGEEREHGLEVRDLVRAHLPPGSMITLESIKDKTGKYGRYLARVYKGDWCLNDWLLAEGHATAYPE